jgi:hypothetical protein
VTARPQRRQALGRLGAAGWAAAALPRGASAQPAALVPAMPAMADVLAARVQQEGVGLVAL